MFKRLLMSVFFVLFLVLPSAAQDEDRSDHSQFLEDNPGVHKIEIHELGSSYSFRTEARKIETASQVRRYIVVKLGEADQTYQTLYYISEDEIDPIISFFDDLVSKVEANKEFPQETHFLFRSRSGISMGARFHGGKWKLLLKRPSGIETRLRTGDISEFRDMMIEGKSKLGL